MRLFVAIDLPEKIKNDLKCCQAQLKKHFSRVRFTREDNFHITLKFLGDVEPDKVNQICCHLKRIAANVKPFELNIDGLGSFDSEPPYRIIWAGITGDMAVLVNLQRQIDSMLVPLGFKQENRPYHPHITIARDAQHEKYLWHNVCVMPNGSFLVRNFCLFESTVENKRRVYTALDRFKIN